MNKFMVCAAVIALSSSVSAQPQLMAADCVHMNYPGHFADIERDASADLSKIYGPVVPANEVWVVEHAGLIIRNPVTPSLGQEFKFDIIEPFADELGWTSSAGNDAQIGACCFRIAIHTPPPTYGEPLVALPPGGVILRPGQRLGARTTAKYYEFHMTGLMVRYPGACLAALQWGR